MSLRPALVDHQGGPITGNGGWSHVTGKTSDYLVPGDWQTTPSSWPPRPPSCCACPERRRTRYRCLPPHHAGDNPERLRSEAAWAHLCGVSPIQASSGKVTRHRLNRGGNRQANSALWRIVMVRIAHDPDTKAYLERRVREGRSKNAKSSGS